VGTADTVAEEAASTEVVRVEVEDLAAWAEALVDVRFVFLWFSRQSSYSYYKVQHHVDLHSAITSLTNSSTRVHQQRCLWQAILLQHLTFCKHPNFPLHLTPPSGPKRNWDCDRDKESNTSDPSFSGFGMRAGRKDIASSSRSNRTLTDFRIVGVECPEMGWSWGVIKSGSSESKEEKKDEEDNEHSNSR
jgi:hypothetical protein